MVGHSDIMVEVGHIGIDFLEVVLIFRPEEFLQELGWGRNRLLDLGTVADVVPDKLEGLDERVVFTTDLAGQLGGIFPGFLVVEEVAMLEGDVLDTLETPEEVEVPVAAAELAIGHGLEPRGLLLMNQVNDQAVLNSGEVGPADLAGRKLLPRVLQFLGTQERTNNVVAKWGNSPWCKFSYKTSILSLSTVSSSTGSK